MADSVEFDYNKKCTSGRKYLSARDLISNMCKQKGCGRAVTEIPGRREPDRVFGAIYSELIVHQVIEIICKGYFAISALSASA